MLAIDYCVETKKNKRKKQEELSKYEENETKPRPKQINKSQNHLQDIQNYKATGL